MLPVDTLIHNDSITGLKLLPDSFAHLILSDIPYGLGAEDWDVLHRDTNSAYMGSSPAQVKAGAVFRKRGSRSTDDPRRIERSQKNIMSGAASGRRIGSER